MLLVISTLLLGIQADFDDCKDSCGSEYEDGISSCARSQDTPEDNDSLIRCVKSAKDDYRDCVEECREDPDSH